MILRPIAQWAAVRFIGCGARFVQTDRVRLDVFV